MNTTRMNYAGRTKGSADMNRKQHLIAVVLACAFAFTSVYAQQKTPGYNTKIPDVIMTPGKVETPIGTLEFFDGMPSEATAEKVYDYIDRARGVETFLNGIPATSIEGLRRGTASIGATTSHHVVIFDRLMDSNPLFLTGNTETVYASIFLDLKKDGPTVVEVPPKTGPGTVNDAYFRFVVDMGGPGPDRGQGGKYLILPPDYEGPLKGPIGAAENEINGVKYFVARSPSYSNWVILRGFLVDGKTDAATAMFKNGLKVYPLAQAGKAPAMEFISGSEKVFNTIHANTYEFYEELHAVMEREPVSLPDAELRGLFASIGIQKGKPFAPDARMKRILTEAVAIGNATARALVFRPRSKDSPVYPNSTWSYTFVGGSHEWLSADKGSRNLDARTLFFYQCTVNTPAMVRKMIGLGSQYIYNPKDTQGRFLDGAKNYKTEYSRQPTGKGLLVDYGLRPADAVGAADRPAFPQQEQSGLQAHHQRRRIGGSLFRSQSAGGQGGELDPDGAWQRLVCLSATLRPARALVRQDLEARRNRADSIGKEEQT